MNLPADLFQIAHLIHLCDEDARSSSLISTELRQELTSLSECASALAKTIATALAQSTRLDAKREDRASDDAHFEPVDTRDEER